MILHVLLSGGVLALGARGIERLCREKQIVDFRTAYDLIRSLAEDRDREHLWPLCPDAKSNSQQGAG